MSDTVTAEMTKTKKLTKAEAIRQAFRELGIDADSNLVRERASSIAEQEVDNRTVYQMRSNIKNGRDATAAAEAVAPKPKAAKEAKAPKAKATRVKSAKNATRAPVNNKFAELLEKVQAVKNCLEMVGGKENLHEILAIID
jgi:hypothetical protein